MSAVTTTAMNTEIDLMAQRYKVIATYPKSIYKVGNIYNYGIVTQDLLYADTDGPRMRDYPHLFQPLPWYAEREESQMPKYVKLVCNSGIQYVHKVEKWAGKNSYLQPLYTYFNLSNYLMTACVSELLPATKEEFEDYQTFKKQNV